MSGLASLLISTLLKPLTDAALKVFQTAQQRKLTEAEARAAVQKALSQALKQAATTELAARRDVLLAELKGESRLQRLWRPIVALSFAFVLLFYALILPVAVDWFGLPPVRVGDTLLGWIMTSVNIAIGGYIGGRTLEKIVAGARYYSK